MALIIQNATMMDFVVLDKSISRNSSVICFQDMDLRFQAWHKMIIHCITISMNCILTKASETSVSIKQHRVNSGLTTGKPVG